MFTLACKDMGTDCPYVAKGETKEEALKDSMGHAVKEHGMDPAELSKMDVWQKAMPFLKEEA
jgi:predicted small metal-binding protein